MPVPGIYSYSSSVIKITDEEYEYESSISVKMSSLELIIICDYTLVLQTFIRETVKYKVLLKLQVQVYGIRMIAYYMQRKSKCAWHR